MRRKDLETPSCEFIDRELKPHKEKRRRSLKQCVYCQSSSVRVLKKNLFLCLSCNRKFERPKDE